MKLYNTFETAAAARDTLGPDWEVYAVMYKKPGSTARRFYAVETEQPSTYAEERVNGMWCEGRWVTHIPRI